MGLSSQATELPIPRPPGHNPENLKGFCFIISCFLVAFGFVFLTGPKIAPIDTEGKEAALGFPRWAVLSFSTTSRWLPLEKFLHLCPRISSRWPDTDNESSTRARRTEREEGRTEVQARSVASMYVGSFEFRQVRCRCVSLFFVCLFFAAHGPRRSRRGSSYV